jgi:hypothetical protein
MRAAVTYTAGRASFGGDLTYGLETAGRDYSAPLLGLGDTRLAA